MSKDKDNKNTNLVKSTTNDQIENNNDEVNKISCNDCKYNPQNITLTKREQFLNLIGMNIGEEYYISGEEKNSSYLIYHLTDDLHLLARSSNDKEGILGWYTATSLGKLLNEDVKLIKILERE